MVSCLSNLTVYQILYTPVFYHGVTLHIVFLRIVSFKMGGGTSIWASPEWRTDPKEIFNPKLFYLATTVAFAGCSYGFDQGNIGGVLTLPSFRHAFGLDKLSVHEADRRGKSPAKQRVNTKLTCMCF